MTRAEILTAVLLLVLVLALACLPAPVQAEGAIEYQGHSYTISEYIAGQDFGHNNDAVLRRALDGSELVNAWLRDQGLVIVHAVAAMPRDLKLLDGAADFLEWDAAARRFVMAPAPPQVGQAPGPA